MGELTEQERSEVEQALLRNPELRQELALVEEAQETLLMKTSVRPNASVKTSLFEKLDNVKPAGNVVRMTYAFWKYAAAASIALAVLSSYLAYDFHSKWKNSEVSLNNLIARNQQMANDYNQVNQRLDKIEKDLNVIDDPAFRRVIMKGTDSAPGAIASVYWNESSNEVYLSIQNMKTLAQNNQYQLWAIVDGKPVDAGVFDGAFAGLVKMKNIDGTAAAFAVTIEPRGGKPTPTMPIQVVGNVI